jgi:hypothetical protein
MSEFECLHFDVDKLPTHEKDLIQTKLEYMRLTTLSNGPKPGQTCADGVLNFGTGLK